MAAAPPARAPRVIFTSASLGRRRLEPGRPATVDNGDHGLVARFSALSFAHESRLAFRYRFAGRSGEWTETREREVSAPNLAPGAYRLDDYSGDIQEFIKDEVGEAATIYGHSLGALVGIDWRVSLQTS